VSGAGTNVLLIDDDPDMHHAVKLILEPLGYQVACYATGPAGLEAIRREPPHVILLDIMLSSPSEGLEVAATLKGDDRFKRIPIIMISAIGQQFGPGLAEQAAVNGVKGDRFLEKPLDARALLRAVREVLEAGG
jgi:CheY-like chemotaxis protein